jgi:phosphatidylglycerol:prolipoprotein diacylglycerol transferase
MFPILFQIPGLGLPIKSFGLMVVLGFLLGAYVFDRLVSRYAPDAEEKRAGYSAVPIWVLIGILIGARVLYVLVEVLQGSPVGQSYLDQPWKVFAYWEGGLVMYGGTMGAIVGGLWCTKRHHLKSARTFDLGVVAAFTGLCIGRIGCLLVGDDYGRIVPPGFENAPFPLVLHVPDPLPNGSLFGEENAGHVLWATQVWMSANALILSWLGARHLRRRRFGGQTGLLVLLGYSITRGIIECFRGDSVRGLWFGNRISTSQIISIVLGVVCLVLLWRNRGRTDATLTSTAPTSSP